MEITFDMSEINAMGERYARAQSIIREEITTGVERSVIAIAADAKELAPVDTGLLRGSIQHDVKAEGDDIVGTAGTNLVYGRPVEEGRKPGTPPPVAPLIRWAVRKGMPEATGYAIAKAIGKRGTRPRPYLKPAYEKNRALISKELGSAVFQRIMNRLGK